MSDKRIDAVVEVLRTHQGYLYRDVAIAAIAAADSVSEQPSAKTQRKISRLTKQVQDLKASRDHALAEAERYRKQAQAGVKTPPWEAAPSEQALPPLPIEWRKVEDADGIAVPVFRAFQMWDYARAARQQPAAQAPAPAQGKPAVWTLRETLDKAETTTTGYLWFTDPKNSAWVPLYTEQAQAPAAGDPAQQPAERVPLTYRQIMDCARESDWPPSMISGFVQAKLEVFARAIERAHGIKPATSGETR